MRLQAREVSAEGLGPISLDLTAGECVTLTGTSGAGKTRLLRLLADLDPHHGSLALDGVDASQIPPPQWRRQVGLLPADSRWWGRRVAEHFPAEQLDFEPIGLPAAAWQWEVTRLSSGERQRLALLRLLVNRPKVLLLDEPTANLDARNAARIEALIADYREHEQAAVLWVSHDAEQIARVADRQLFIEAGCLVDRLERTA